MVGIGGAGLSAIAKVMHERGEMVSGSDQARSDYAVALEQAGVPICYEHRAENVRRADVVLASSAIPESNVELQAARELEIPVLRRREFLGALTAGYRTVAVAGTHGKSTTTGLIAWLLDNADLSPTFIVGAMLSDYGVNARAGSGEVFVIEADEYDHAFLGLHPQIAVVTNIEHDHPDFYPTEEDFRRGFERFVEQVQERLVLCLDDPGAAALHSQQAEVVTYGVHPDADWRPEEMQPNAAGGMDFLALRHGETLGLVRTRLPGEHNVLNVLAAFAVIDELDLEFKGARDAVREFTGLARRFEIVGEAGGVVVVDDYAHHPTEISATLKAARERYPGHEIWAVFQPHTYSRTKTFLSDLAEAFADADHLIVTEIFAARESEDPSISGRLAAENIKHTDIRFHPGFEAVVNDLLERVQPKALVIVLSAGDANRICQMLLSQLNGVKGEA
jgi:UDP-N-acetylmuramate--alanine ligase